MTECTGPEPEPQEPEETEQPQEDEAKGSGMGGLVVFLVVALIGGGAALYFFKFKKPKADTKGGDELDEYDFWRGRGRRGRTDPGGRGTRAG